MHRSHRITTSWFLTLAFAAAPFGLGACGVQEASAMTKFADQMCACTDTTCADKVFTDLEKLSKENEGKEVVAAAADKYNNEMDRAQKCYEKIHTDAEKTAAQ